MHLSLGGTSFLVDDFVILDVMRLGRLAGIADDDIGAWAARFRMNGISLPARVDYSLTGHSAKVESQSKPTSAPAHYETKDRYRHAVAIPGMSRTLLKLEPGSLLVHHDIHDGGRLQV